VQENKKTKIYPQIRTILLISNYREMLTKCWHSGSTMVTADDTESVAYALTPGKERRSSPTCRHHPRTIHLSAATASSLVATAASRRRLHAAGHSATAMRPI